MPIAKYFKNQAVIFTGHHNNYPSKIRTVSSKPRFSFFGFSTVVSTRHQQYCEINSILGCSCIDLSDVITLNYYRIQLKNRAGIHMSKDMIQEYIFSLQ